MDSRAIKLIADFEFAKKTLVEEYQKTKDEAQAKLDSALIPLKKQLEKDLEAIFGDQTFDSSTR